MGDLELKERFRAKTERLRAKQPPAKTRTKQQGTPHWATIYVIAWFLCFLLLVYVESPPLPGTQEARLKKPKEEMEDFLDDLLS